MIEEDLPHRNVIAVRSTNATVRAIGILRTARKNVNVSESEHEIVNVIVIVSVIVSVIESVIVNENETENMIAKRIVKGIVNVTGIAIGSMVATTEIVIVIVVQSETVGETLVISAEAEETGANLVIAIVTVTAGIVVGTIEKMIVRIKEAVETTRRIIAEAAVRTRVNHETEDATHAHDLGRVPGRDRAASPLHNSQLQHNHSHYYWHNRE